MRCCVFAKVTLDVLVEWPFDIKCIVRLENGQRASCTAANQISAPSCSPFDNLEGERLQAAKALALISSYSTSDCRSSILLFFVP